MGGLRKEGCKKEEADKWREKATDREKLKGITAGVVQH